MHKTDLLMTGIILAVIIYRFFKAVAQFQNRPEKGFQFALEIMDRNQKSLIIPVDNFLWTDYALSHLL